jgi:hypothetical protein
MPKGSQGRELDSSAEAVKTQAMMAAAKRSLFILVLLSVWFDVDSIIAKFLVSSD